MKIFILIQVITSSKKSSLVSGNRPGKIFFITYPSANFLFKNTHTHKQKAKQTKEEKRKTKETKRGKERENVVANSICGKSNLIRNCLQIFSVYF